MLSRLCLRPVISQASCRRLPAFYFDYRLTDIGDNIAGNYVKKIQTIYTQISNAMCLNNKCFDQ